MYCREHGLPAQDRRHLLHDCNGVRHVAEVVAVAAAAAAGDGARAHDEVADVGG